MKEKPCRKCGVIKEVGTRCKICRKEYHKQWHKENYVSIKKQKKIVKIDDRVYVDSRCKLYQEDKLKFWILKYRKSLSEEL